MIKNSNHLFFPLTKCVVRISGLVALFFAGSIIIFCIALISAELLGILEEVVSDE